MFANPKTNKHQIRNFVAQETNMREKQYKNRRCPGERKIFEKKKDKMCENWLNFGVDKKYNPIYAMYGCCIPLYDLQKIEQELKNLLKGEISQWKRENEIGVNLIFFSKCKAKKQNWRGQKYKNISFPIFIDQVVKRLEPRLLKKIKFIHACHESKPFSFFNFYKNNPLDQLIDRITIYCSSLWDLTLQLGPLFECELIKENVQDVENSRKWLLLYGEQEKKKERRNYEQMGKEPFEDEQFGFFEDLGNYRLGKKTGIPMILEQIFEEIHEKHANQQGIFRKACLDENLRSIQRQISILESKKEEMACIDSKQYRSVIQSYDGDTLASTIKLFFKRLNPPLFDFLIYQELRKNLEILYEENKKKQSNGRMATSCMAYGELLSYNPDFHQIAVELCGKMESQRRKLLLETIFFLILVVVPQQKENKMSVQNLAIVFTPCLLRPKFYSVQDMLQASKMVQFVQYLMNHPEILV